MWQRKLKKRIKWTSNFPAQTLRNDTASNFSVKLCLNVFKAEVRAQNAEHPLLLHFESIWDNLTSQSLSTNCTIIFHFLYLLWACCGNKQNNTLAQLHRHCRTPNKSSKRWSYLLLTDRCTCSVLCSECRDKAGDGIRVGGAVQNVSGC